MQFGICVATKIDDWRLIQLAEELGYDAAWVPDSQMIWSDCYATLALAAEHTSRIRLGTGVAIPGTRLAPVTAHSIATINRIAPGRVFLGIGTGHTAMRVMGMDPMRLKDFREYLRVVRGLLRGEEVDFTLGGVTRPTRFLHLDRGFIDVEHPIPIYVAANAPKALRLAGELGDGLVSGVKPSAETARRYLRAAGEGARAAGRDLPADYHSVALTTAFVLRPGEKLTSERVIDSCGAWTASALHFAYEVFRQTGQEKVVPVVFRRVWEEYCTYVDAMPLAAERRHLGIHNGHATFLLPEERRFMTPEAIAACCLVGEPDEIIAQLRDAEAGSRRAAGDGRRPRGDPRSRRVGDGALLSRAITRRGGCGCAT